MNDSRVGLLGDRILALFNVPLDEPPPAEGPVLEIAVAGDQPLQICLGQRSVAVLDRPAPRATLRIEADERLLTLFGQGGEGLGGLPDLWLHGGFRVRRFYRGGFRLAIWFLRYGRKLVKRTGS